MTPIGGVFRGPAWVEAKPPKAVDLTYGSALGLGPSLGRFHLDAYLDASEVMFLFGRLYWTLPFGRLFLDE